MSGNGFAGQDGGRDDIVFQAPARRPLADELPAAVHRDDLDLLESRIPKHPLELSNRGRPAGASGIQHQILPDIGGPPRRSHHTPPPPPSPPGAAFPGASAIRPGVMPPPRPLPSAPPCAAARKQSNPAPLPRSRTTS